MFESAQKFIERQRESIEKNPFRTWPDISGKGSHTWKIESVSFMPQSSLKEKLLMIQRLRHVKETGVISYKAGNSNRVEYRIGYYIVGKKGKKKDKWTWGQSAPILPKTDFFELIELAKRERTFI